MTPENDHHVRNVRVVVALEIRVPDAAANARVRGAVDDATYERVTDLMHDTFCAGDPDDELQAVLTVEEISLVKRDDA